MNSSWNKLANFFIEIDINKKCQLYQNMNDDEIANFIGNLLLKNLPKSSNGIYKYDSNKTLPYCLLEDGALAVSLFSALLYQLMIYKVWLSTISKNSNINLVE